MHAAVVHSFDHPPRYEHVDPPQPGGDHELVVDVLAAGLHPRTRSGAAGSHYTSTDALPLVPGIDGVGRTAAGELRYFILPDTTLGAMAERTLIDPRRSVALPGDADPVVLAAAMNPAMSSWVALRKRVDFRPGARVLILGATGNAGRLAVQIAKHLGAAHVIGAGRDPQRLALLEALGADATVSLDGDPERAAERLAGTAADVDLVLDYLWGATTGRAIPAIVAARSDRARPLDWIEIGSITGPTIALPSAALRAANLRLLGSGQGSVATAEIVAELPALAAAINAGEFTVDPLAVALSDVERAWNAPIAPGQRVVFTP